MLRERYQRVGDRFGRVDLQRLYAHGGRRIDGRAVKGRLARDAVDAGVAAAPVKCPLGRSSEFVLLFGRNIGATRQEQHLTRDSAASLAGHKLCATTPAKRTVMPARIRNDDALWRLKGSRVDRASAPSAASLNISRFCPKARVRRAGREFIS